MKESGWVYNFNCFPIDMNIVVIGGGTGTSDYEIGRASCRERV